MSAGVGFNIWEMIGGLWYRIASYIPNPSHGRVLCFGIGVAQGFVFGAGLLHKASSGRVGGKEGKHNIGVVFLFWEGDTRGTRIRQAIKPG